MRPTHRREDGTIPGVRADVVRSADQPALERLVAGPESGGEGAPLLFVHGAFAGAWCWAETFLPFFGRRGRQAVAVSLRGHGASEGGDELRGAALDDLASDLGRAIASFAEPPVVVAHSLGGYLAQLLIGRARMRGLVLMGSLPPDGMALVGPRLAMTEPKIWSQAVAATVTNSRATIDLAGLQLLFGEGVPREKALRYGARLIPESPRALAEAHLPRPVVSALLAGLPTLVLNGVVDRLVWPSTALRSAAYHASGHRFFAEGGHFLMLDPLAEDVAREILDWLAARRL